MKVKESLFEKSARAYNLYAKKQIRVEKANELRFIRRISGRHLKGNSISLLDVGCGEGRLAKPLSNHYQVTGIDSDRKAIALARRNAKGAKFIVGDMRRFSLGKEFDIIVSIHAIDHGDEQRKEIGKTLRNLDTHLKSRGILVFDINFCKEHKSDNVVTTTYATPNNTRFVHIFRSYVKGNTSNTESFVTMLKGGKAQIEFSTHKSPYLLDISKIGKIMEGLGLRMYVYNGWSTKTWNGKEKIPPVFVCRKL